MWLRDYASNLTVLRGISPVSGAIDNTAQVSQIIDTADYDGIVFVLGLGAIADIDATFVMLLEHSDDPGMAGAVAVPDDMLNSGLTKNTVTTPEVLASFQFDSDDKTRKIGYHGDKRYVRLTLTPVANTGAWLVALLVLGFGNRRNPPALSA